MTAKRLPSPNACWNTLGRDTNVKPAPAPTSSGFMPILNTEGKMMKPAMTAMKVSMKETFTADFANGVFLSK